MDALGATSSLISTFGRLPDETKPIYARVYSNGSTGETVSYAAALFAVVMIFSFNLSSNTYVCSQPNSFIIQLSPSMIEFYVSGLCGSSGNVVTDNYSFQLSNTLLQPTGARESTLYGVIYLYR